MQLPRSMRNKRAWLSLIALLLAGLLATPISAQPTDSDAAEAEATEDRVLVTALHREQDLQDVAVAVTSFDSDRLRDMGADGFIDYARMVPGLSFASRGTNRAKIVIRGLSPLTGVAPVGIYLDGVGSRFAFNNPDFALFDVERVEILRGPQGTLYGEGALGGAINIITNKPDPSAFSGAFDGTYGSIDSGGAVRHANAMINVPLVENQVALRATAFNRDTDGFLDNIFLGIDDVNSTTMKGGRVALRALVTDNFSAEAIVNYQRTELGGLNVRTVGDPAALGLPFPAFDRFDVARTVQEREDEKNTQATLLLNYQMGNGFLESITGYNTVDDVRVIDAAFFFGAVAIGLPTGLSNQTDTFTQEVRFVSELGGRAEFIAGAYYRDRERDAVLLVDGGAALFGIPGDFLNVLSERIETSALFGEVYYQMAPRLEATFGLRLNRDQVRAVALNTVGPIVASESDGKDTFTTVSPKFSLAYDLSDEAMLYGTVGRGFRSGGINGQFSPDPAFQPSFKSDSAWSYEVGIKSQWLDRRLTVNATAFYTDWQDLQILGLPDNPALGWTTNAGRAHTAGLELEALFTPVTGLDLGFSGAYTEAELDDPAQGAPAGSRLTDVPKWSFSASAQYRRPLFADVMGFARLDWQYKSSTNSNLLGLPQTEVPAYHFSNARVGAEWSNWAAYLFVNNLGNDLGISWVASSGQYVAQPRTVGLTLRASF